MKARLEIYKDTEWVQLKLQNQETISYNDINNRIGTINERELSHSNTFNVPLTAENTNALNLNIFNKAQIAYVLNKKYDARYYLGEVLLKKGYVIINNLEDGINLNFYEEALSLTEEWAKTTYAEFLDNQGLDFPVDYLAAIEEMRNYVMDQEALIPQLSEVGSRGYRLALFPNNLNSIGEKFQENDQGVRDIQAFNPYQSRPIFNAKALFDLAIETYGYTPDYDASIDWTKLEDEYIVTKNPDAGREDVSGYLTLNNPPVAFNYEYSQVLEVSPDRWTTKTMFIYPDGANNVQKPINVTNWSDPTDIGDAPVLRDYKEENCIYVPNVTESFAGIMTFQVSVAPFQYGAYTKSVYACWHNADKSQVYFSSTGHSSSGIEDITITIDKGTILANMPVEVTSDGFIGVIVQIWFTNKVGEGPLHLNNMVVTEEYVPSGVIGFDQLGQFLQTNVNLTQLAPNQSLSKLLSGLMERFGILIDINVSSKTVKLFSYKQYQTQRGDGKYYDWTPYLRRHSKVEYNTNFGNNFAKRNNIGLASPFTGNINIVRLNNQGIGSKYKDEADTFNKIYKDVEKVIYLDHPITPYWEYKNTGLGLVEHQGYLTGLFQVRIPTNNNRRKESPGPISNLPSIANVNYLDLPDGVTAWFDLVDLSIRVKAYFLLPVHVVKNLDKSYPIYVEDLGGFYILEEISEYEDAQTEVEVNLIKLIDFENKLNNFISYKNVSGDAPTT